MWPCSFRSSHESNILSILSSDPAARHARPHADQWMVPRRLTWAVPSATSVGTESCVPPVTH